MARSRKRPRLGAVRIGDKVGDKPEWARVNVLDNGLITPRPRGPVDMKKKGIPEPNAATGNLYALNMLQQREDQPANDHVLRYCLQRLQSYLPKAVSEAVYFGEQPGEDADFSRFVHDDEFAENLVERWPATHEMFRNMKLAPYFFWPVNTGNNHYVTVIMVLGKDEAAEAERAELLRDTRRVHDEELQVPIPFDQVLQWSVVDPERGRYTEERVGLVEVRVQRILEMGGIKFDDNVTRFMESRDDARYAHPWVPPQTDDWSSGMRSFALIRRQCDIVVQFHCEEIEWDRERFWGAAPGFLNVHAIRHEMMGMLAVNCIQDMGWMARIAIEPVYELDGVKGQSRFYADQLKPKEPLESYYTQVDLNGPDSVRASRGWDLQDDEA
ncbi:hypothetical protein DL769_007704 [Monosporascus sp. CRB-8-3]|nr:hypothetical protein DL769_007704 [Monosporascus sp. CRB-8-3]